MSLKENDVFYEHQREIEEEEAYKESEAYKNRHTTLKKNDDEIYLENAGEEFLESLRKFNEVLEGVIESTNKKKKILEGVVKNGNEIKYALNNYKR